MSYHVVLGSMAIIKYEGFRVSAPIGLSDSFRTMQGDKVK